jgi:hypothetical protein
VRRAFLHSCAYARVKADFYSCVRWFRGRFHGKSPSLGQKPGLTLEIVPSYFTSTTVLSDKTKGRRDNTRSKVPLTSRTFSLYRNFVLENQSKSAQNAKKICILLSSPKGQSMSSAHHWTRVQGQGERQAAALYNSTRF